ncbi:MAG: hypothetical protein AABX70_05585 [Nanoarchaeota archaeon]
MANPDAVSYIKQYKSQYSLESLKQALQQQGYTAPEIEEAVREAINPSVPAVPRPVPAPLNLARNSPPPIPQSAPSPPPKKSNTRVIIVVLLLLLPLLLVGCLIAVPMLFFASTAATYSSYLPFLAYLAKTESITHSSPTSPYTSTSSSPSSAGNKNKEPSLQVQAVDFHTLMQSLPSQAIDGYAPEKAEGGSVAFPTEKGSSTQYSTASNQYTHLDRSIKISILDTAGIEGLSYMYALGSVEYERSDGYRRKTTLRGYPAWETYDAVNKKTHLIVIVHNQVYVSIDSSQGEVPIEVIREAANQVNYDLIASS